MTNHGDLFGGAFWLELMVRSGVLLAVGEALRRLSGGAGAAFRHRLLVWLFAGLMMLPVLAVVLPEVPIRFGSAARGVQGAVTVEQGAGRVIQMPANDEVNWPLSIWLAGFTIGCVPLVVGIISMRLMVKRAKILKDKRLREIAKEMSGGIAVLVSEELRVPVTCGVLHPRILLPATAERWCESRLEAVLLHELAHVRRRDLLVQMLAQLVAAVWWFQPLVWLLRRELRSESELACDAEVIGGGFRASTYAEELLAVAKSANREWRLSGSAVGMVRQGGLERRVRAVLNPPAATVLWWRISAVTLLLGAASVAASAVSLGGSESSDGLGGPIMKRTIISALLTSAGLTAGTVGGLVHDANGSAIGDAKVTIYSADKKAKQEAATGSDGRFNLSLGAGQYILRVEKPGFVSLFRAFDLKADSTVARDFTMPSEGGKAVADSTIAPATAEPKRIRVGGQVAQENLEVKITPTYPLAAKQAGVQGVVEIYVTISREGVPVDLRVMSSPSDDLSASALEAVSQWRYRPTLLNGNPVEIETTVIVHYTLTK